MTLYLGTNKIAGVEAPIVDQTFDGTSANAQSGVAIAGELSNYADKDFSNVSNTAKSSVVSWSLPSSTKIGLTAAFGTYTAPADGWVLAYGRATANTSYIYAKNETTGFQLQIWISANNNGSYAFVPVNKGDTFRIGGYNNTLAANTFYYANGNESEAS